MARHIETLHGGLVTSRDPALLIIGEMTVMQNAVYYPNNLAPQRAAGRALFGSVGGGTHLPIRGLRDAKFDNGDHFMLAMQGNDLASAAVGDTGTFIDFFTYTGTGTALDAVHFNNEWFLFGASTADTASASSNAVLYLSSTASGQTLNVRRHGLPPNRSQVSTATGAGTWTAGATGYFEYWFTEVFEYVHDGITSRIEGTFNPSGIPTTLFVSSTAMQASIYIPGAPTAPSAQKWILYRGGPKSLSTDQEFPTGFKLAEGQFGTTTTVLDGSATTGSYISANATADNGSFVDFTTPTNVFASDDAYATEAAGLLTPAALVVTFPTFTIVEPVVSIGVKVEIKTSGGGRAVVDISGDAGVTWSRNANLELTTSDVVLTVAPGDTWGLNLTAAELVAGRFRVRVVAHGGGIATPTISIDHIQANVVHGGSEPLDESTPFPAIVIAAAGVDAAVGSHGHPPLATTGAIFQGCLVTNSLRPATNGAPEKSFIRYSLPDQPDYFPDPYYLDFQTEDNDEITNIKNLNNRLGVFLKSRLYRVNYLPTEADADFNRGICREEVSSQYGCVNAMCACLYEGAGGRSEIAFVSDYGIHSSNLFSLHDLTDDLEWRNIIATTNSSPIALINDPENEELLFYYKNSNSGSEHYLCLHLNYSSQHVRPGGRLKISGPVHMRNHVGGNFGDLYSAWVVQRSAGNAEVFLGYGGENISATAASAGSVLREQATSIPALDSTMKLRTRRMYLSGLGDEMRLDRVFTYVASANTNQNIRITPYYTLTNDANAPITGDTQTRPWAGEKMFELSFIENAEGLEIEIAQASNNQGHFAPQMLVCDWTDFGVQDSGKA